MRVGSSQAAGHVLAAITFKHSIVSLSATVIYACF